MKESTVELVFERETKNTVRYHSEVENDMIDVLYIQKSAFKNTNYPQAIRVKVEILS